MYVYMYVCMNDFTLLHWSWIKHKNKFSGSSHMVWLKEGLIKPRSY